MTLLFLWLKGNNEYLLRLLCVLTIKYLIEWGRYDHLHFTDKDIETQT